MASRREFRNWSSLVRCQAQEVVTPKSLHELQTVVSRSKKLRVKGTGHSFNACVATPDTLLHSECLNKVLGIDTQKKQVKVEAGIKLKDLNPILWQHGLAFPSLGDIAEQAMAGLVATGTHGTGLAWGSFSDARTLIGMELVLADGTLLELRADRAEDAALLEAARLSLGAMGVIYSLSFQLVEAHQLECSSRVVLQEEASDPALYKTHDHYEYFLFPFHNEVLTVVRNRTDKAAESSHWKAWFNDVFMENYMLDFLLRCSALWPTSIERTMRLMAELASEEHFVGRCYDVMATVRRVRFYEIEYAFALDAMDQALQIYHDVNRHFAKRTGPDRYYASFPGEVRFLGGDTGTLLSPTLGQPTAYLAAQVFPAFGPGYEAYFRTLEAEFRRIGGRPHWGKLFYRNPMSLYPRFAAWSQIRQQWDPGEKFLNPFLQTLLRGEDF